MQTDLFIIRTPLQYAKGELLDWKIIFQTQKFTLCDHTTMQLIWWMVKHCMKLKSGV